jgi:hypothetical protein
MERIWDIHRPCRALPRHPIEGVDEQPPHIVILGSGFAGANRAASLKTDFSQGDASMDVWEDEGGAVVDK